MPVNSNYGTFAGTVGVQALSDGTNGPIRVARDGSLVDSGTHGKYKDAVVDGNVYSAMTAVTGVAPGTALGTTAAFALHNPVGSAKRLSILQAQMTYVSGTLGTGAVFYCVNNTAPTAGTAIAPVNCKTFTATGASALAYTTATVVAPIQLKAFCSLTPILATSVVTPFNIVDYVDGSIVVPPGGTLVLHAVAAAGTSPLVQFTVIWDEIPS